MLEGLKVLEFSAMGPVPWSAMLLADQGANVLVVRRPGEASEPDAGQRMMGRGRLSITLDLKQPDDVARARALMRQADVVLEGMRPGVMERLGLGPETALADNPKLVYARMTGWGQDGPMAQRAGHDINYIALSGVLNAIGPADGPPVAPLNLLGDYGGGGAFMLIGVLSALWRVARGGAGAVVDAAMVDGVANLSTLIHARIASGQWRDQRGVNSMDGGAPWYTVYKTSDDQYMAVGAIEPAFYAQLLTGLGIDTDQFPDRMDPTKWPEIHARFTAIFASRTRAAWTEIFDPTDACVSPVLNFTEAAQHPHHRARGTYVQWEQHVVPAPAPRFDGRVGKLADYAPGDADARWAAWGDAHAKGRYT